MTLKNIAKNYRFWSFLLEIFVIVLVAFLTTLMATGFDIMQFDYVMFTLSTMYSIYGRAVATSYSSGTEKAVNTDVRLLAESVFAKRKLYFASDKQKAFDEVLYYYNCQRCYEQYYLDLSKKHLFISPGHKRHEKITTLLKNCDTLLKLLKNKKYEEFETLSKEYQMYSIRRNYPYLTVKTTHLWCGTATSDKTNNDAFAFNSAKSSINYAMPSMVGIALFNFMLSSLIVGFNGTAETIIKLCSYLFSIVMGISWGIRNGKRIISDDYRNILSNNLKLIKMLFQDAGIKDNGAD